MWVGPGDHRIVGECLAGARKAARVSQDELAARLRKPQSFISSYERGQRRIDVMEFLIIAAALDADADKLFAGIAKDAEAVVSRAFKGRRRAKA